MTLNEFLKLRPKIILGELMAENRLLSLSEIFNQKIFRIPDFQRGYSWTEEQLEDFWGDIQNLKSDRIHYTGLLTVEAINKQDVAKVEKWQEDLWLLEKGLNAYYVIDGQQRLTTSIILIHEIMKLFKDEDGINFDRKETWVNKFLYQKYAKDYKSYIFGYERDNPSDEFFKTMVLEQESSTADKVPKQTLYTSNLIYAKKFFENKLNALNKENTEELFKKVVNKLKFNFYEIDTELDVFVTFETMNNRGKSLSNLELLKNRLIYLSTLFDDDSASKYTLRKNINESWKTIYEYLGRDKNKPLDDDEFLKNHWIMYFKFDKSESNAYSQFLLQEHFTLKAVTQHVLSLEDVEAYITSLAKSVQQWYYLHSIQNSPYQEDLKEWVQKLKRVGMGAFRPLFMAAMLKEKNEMKLLELFKAAERFVFLMFHITQRPSNTKSNHFYRMASTYYFERNHDGSKLSIDRVIANINFWLDGTDDEGEYVGWVDLSKFKSYIEELGKKDEGYYSWGGLRYFLYEYELSLQSKAKGNTKITWADFNKRKKEDTIEHIYPQTDTKECWQLAFKGLGKKDKKSYLHSLGNLLLLGHSKNSELQNNCFDYKKKHTNKDDDEVGYFNGSYSEIEVSSYSKWTPIEIQERGLKMLSFMEERWDVDTSEWDGFETFDLLNLPAKN